MDIHIDWNFVLIQLFIIGSFILIYDGLTKIENQYARIPNNILTKLIRAITSYITIILFMRNLSLYKQFSDGMNLALMMEFIMYWLVILFSTIYS